MFFTHGFLVSLRLVSQLLILCIDLLQMVDHTDWFTLQEMSTHHVALRVHGPTCQWLDYANLFEMSGQDPDKTCRHRSKNVEDFHHKVASFL